MRKTWQSMDSFRMGINGVHCEGTWGTTETDHTSDTVSMGIFCDEGNTREFNGFMEFRQTTFRM